MDEVREKRLKELKCKLFPLWSLESYKYVVICTSYNGKWVMSRHKNRNTWETQGGHIEFGETPDMSAERELFEESGITDAEIYPICDYLGYDDWGSANGVVYLAVVHSLGEMPESEMSEISLFESVPNELTYPLTSPVLYKEAEKFMAELKNKQKNTEI